MEKDIDVPRQDRSADRNEIADLMADYARQGGMVSQLDWAGNLVALVAEQPTAPRPLAKVLPFKAPVVDAPKPAPVVAFAPTVKAAPAKAAPVKKAAPAPTWKTAEVIDIVPELRRIRADAQRALARLNAAADRRTA